MSLGDYSKACLKMLEQIFTPAHSRGKFIAQSIDLTILNRKFDIHNSGSTIKEFVGKCSTADEGDLLKNPDESCKVYVSLCLC